jgi:hypothetical protein
MQLTTQVKKITSSKPFYALAGAGDYAVELGREYAGTAAAKVNEFYDQMAIRGRRIVSEVSREAAHELEDVSETAKPARTPEAREAPGREDTRGRTTTPTR